MALPDDTVGALKRLAKKFAPRTDVPEKDRWQKLGDDAIWKHFVSQVAVVGNSSSHARLSASTDAQEALRFDRLRSVSDPERRRSIHETLRSAGVRYASANIEQCRKTDALTRNFEFLSAFPGGPRAYLAFLATLPDDDTRVARLELDMRYIKLKGARDLLAELGLVTSVVAFDTRLLNILKALGAQLTPGIRTNSLRYKELQDELLTRVCGPIGITGVALDRILYQHYDVIIAQIDDGNT